MLENCEIWKDIKGYPNYQISNLGRIWNCRTQRMLKPSVTPKGYCQINLVAINGKRKKELVHRLVALTFIENPNHYPEVNHINHIRNDNRVENLEWVTRKENINKSSLPVKVAVYQVDGKYVDTYNSIRELCNELNLTESNVSGCLSNKSKQHTHKGYKFKIQKENPI